MRNIMALTLFAALTVPVSFAETLEHPRNLKEEARVQSNAKQRFVWSTVALVAASFADSHSSWGKRESNPMMRSANGTFGGRGFALKMGLVGGMIAGQYVMVKTNPDLAKPLSFANFGYAGVKTAVAIRNYQIAPPTYLARQQ